jgi:hypothetical protein
MLAKVHPWQRSARLSIRLIEHDGKSLSAADWSAITGLSAPTILYRIDVLGWSPERALNEPLGDQIGPNKLSESEQDELLQRYAEEGPGILGAFAAAKKVSRSTLYRALAMAGVPRPGRVPRAPMKKRQQKKGEDPCPRN